MRNRPELTVFGGSFRDRTVVCDFTWWGPTADWDVIGEVHRHERTLFVRTLRLVPHGDDVSDLRERDGAAPTFTPVSPALLRQIPLGRLLAEVHQELLEWASQESMTKDVVPGIKPQWLLHLEQVEGEPAVTTTGRRGGRPRIGDDVLRTVAEAYLQEQIEGRGITRRMAERLGLHPATTRDRIAAARARGYLGPAQHGQRGASPGWRLLQERAVTGADR